jgi:6-phosphogluconate dehydrogenase
MVLKCISTKNAQLLLDHAKATNTRYKVIHHKDYKELCRLLYKPKVFVFSIPHGSVGDKYLERGDVILDASNEHWVNTERQQKRPGPDGIHYVGMGVSGGYQAARHGPSMSPDESREALELVMPFLEKVAAKDKQGRPCVKPLGPSGCLRQDGTWWFWAGHGVDVVWGVIHCLGLEYEEIGKSFEEWNKSGPLVSVSAAVCRALQTRIQYDNFLVSIGADICRTKDPKAGGYVLATTRDKVVQDIDDEEGTGTGTWTCEGVRLRVPILTIAAAYLFWLASADAARQIAVNKSFGRGAKVGSIKLETPPENALKSFVEDVHMPPRAF